MSFEPSAMLPKVQNVQGSDTTGDATKYYSR